MVEGMIPSEQELSTIVKCFKGKGGVLDMRRSTLLKLADHVLNIVEKVIEKLIKQQINGN